MPNLLIERSALDEVTRGLERTAELIDRRREVARCEGAMFGSTIVEAAVEEAVSVLEARRSVIERLLREFAAHPTRVVDDFADLDVAIAGGI
ncbi:hypothetical protein [Agromyces lapidis]|uniref:Uncharacterized protein n=1 Tax=Agromyces lapidis TaxID=279574 RepID=A0ABV5SLK8_9MICO|nr:hypothetical protein [Agromyces lapidis]